ncbi:MAG TPA: 1-deoxy-D-xylulose-5-phosphate reductoisomerase [Thiothrix sp.]|nr:1-deoxy-D-xylulose-5-phosphate reductoisomerase [Thiothrix sp.]
MSVLEQAQAASQSTLQQITILGSTGTIGVNTLDVIARHPNRFKVVALTANRNVDKLFMQCQAFQPDYAVMADEQAAEQLQTRLRTAQSHTPINTQVLSGVEGLIKVSQLPHVDQVMAAIVGAAGLLPTLAAAQVGKRVLLANKEALVMSGQLFMDAVREHGAELLPIDSEHNAIFQCMPQVKNQAQGFSALPQSIERILLTASGGPFRTLPINELDQVTPAQAVAHPNWVMGQKISVDSATMMNKGLEVIEACWLFGTTADAIQVIIHPQSTIHSMVAYNDGSVLAQLGNPDMRTPIAYALAWPERIDAGVAALDFYELAQLDFQAPDEARYPCLQLAYEAHRQGGHATTALNAANEVAVAAFLKGDILFTDIARLVDAVLQQSPSGTAHILDDILIQDAASRQAANLWLAEKKNKKKAMYL